MNNIIRISLILIILSVLATSNEKKVPTRSEMEAKGWVPEEKTLTNKELQEKIASGEWNVAWDTNISKVETANAIARLEAKIWLIEDNRKKVLSSIEKNMNIVWNRLAQLESRGCECEVKCRNKSSRELFEEIEGLLDTMDSRLYEVEDKLDI